MGIVILLGLVALIVAYVAYGNWLEKGIKPRTFDTTLQPTVLRSTFEAKVARSGWKIVDDGNPMVAQSPLLTGIRQQVGLALQPKPDGRTAVRVGPERWVTKWGVPKKAHTIRMRMNAFLSAVQAQDPQIAPVLTDLRGR